MTALTITNLLVLLPLFGIVTAQGAATCDFECMHDSVCGYCDGDAALGNVELCRYGNDGKGRHCQCQTGWSGFRCGQQHESCYDTAHSCYNGGQCIPGLQDAYGTEQYFCDCSDAVDADGEHFFGKYCELKAIVACDTDGRKFCVNNGTCSATATASDVDFCQCSSGYEGPHCEFVKGEVPDCNLSCMNGGKCALGIKNYAMAELGYNDFWNKQEEAMYCQCPPGFFGLRCEISAQACGDHHCFNGATCVTTTIDDAGESYHCDCTTAHTANESFAGKFCQYKSNVFCESSDAIEGRDFCVNGGTCKVGKPGCDCTAGFEGPMCEYNLQVQGGEPDCKLTCDNGGVCTKGVKDVKFLDDIGPAMSQVKDPEHDDNFEHCICAQGFFGLTCDKTIEMCGSGEYVCLNGGKCVSEANNGWSCNCEDIGGNDKRFAGDYCQHEASVYCTPDNTPGAGVEKFSFCTNGGKCKSITQGDGHTGCICPRGFEGESCELPEGSIDNAVSEAGYDRPTSSEGIKIFFSVVAVIIVVLAGAVYIRRRIKQQNEQDKEFVLRDANMCAPAPTHTTLHSMLDDPDDEVVLDFGPDRDQDGTELFNVEIV